MSRVRQALRRMDAARKDWWIVRRDSEPEGVWHVVLDPHGGAWDWGYRVGLSRWRAEMRVTRALETSRTGQKLQQIRALVDMLRSSGEPSASRAREGRGNRA